MDRPITTLFMLASVDGEAVSAADRLGDLGVLKLGSLTPLNDSYFRVRYKVIA